MENLKVVMEFLKNLPPTFWGNVIIKVRDNKAVLLTKEQTFKLDEEEDKREKEKP
jgi:hypothetical protein